MKKSILWTVAVVVMALSFVVTSVSGQGLRKRSQLRSGDKDLSTIEISHKLMVQQAEAYEVKVSRLKTENEKIIRELEYAGSATSSNLTVSRLKTELTKNDSLLRSYNEKIGVLEQASDAFLVNAAGKSRANLYDFRYSDPRVVAQADILMASAEEIRINSHRVSSSATIVDTSKVDKDSATWPKIYLANEWYQTLTVVVTDPGGRKQEYSIPGNFKGEFSWGYSTLIPGGYTIRFIGSRVDACGYKNVGPMYKYVVGKNEYPLVATYVSY